MTMLRIGDWQVNPAAGQISRDGESVRLEARSLRLLLCLAQRAGEVVSIDELLEQAWAGVIVTPDSVYQTIAALRRLLGDDPRQPRYIATVPRLGYRLIAPVDSILDAPAVGPVHASTAVDGSSTTRREIASAARSRAAPRTLLLAIAAVLVAGFIAHLLIDRPSARQATSTSVSALRDPKSIAVLPFLDLTDAMNEEPFADGMTEELIDKLSKVAGLHVPAPTSSFYFKGKQATVAEIAKALGVAYVLDGSVRKSDATLRVAARLVRADDGFVVWSETYDRPFDDKLMVQDDIAAEVTKALEPSIH
jgi:TolB-like protein/DNA-binding winged helix-turn-helix (wHTH) protein